MQHNEELDDSPGGDTAPVARRDASSRTPGRYPPGRAGTARQACARRVPLALYVPRASVRLDGGAHLRADGIVAGIRAAGTGIHRARLVDWRCRACEPAL